MFSFFSRSLRVVGSIFGGFEGMEAILGEYEDYTSFFLLNIKIMQD
jgi:hypothetical protein